MGVTKVSKERWEVAQEWESQHWVRAQKMRSRYGKDLIWRILSLFGIVSKYRGDDWNVWWAAQFDNYSFLPPRVERAVELGCGPYTNMRIVIQKCKPNFLVLNDPLIETYAQFRLTFPCEMYRKNRCLVDSHMIEEIPFPDQYFDLVIMINVLDHVQDAARCLEQAIRITSYDGIFILGQDLSSGDDVTAMQGAEGEEGHPIKIDHHFIDHIIGGHFKPIIRNILERELGRAPSAHYGTYIFVGRRCPVL